MPTIYDSNSGLSTEVFVYDAKALEGIQEKSRLKIRDLYEKSQKTIVPLDFEDLIGIISDTDPKFPEFKEAVDRVFELQKKYPGNDGVSLLMSMYYFYGKDNFIEGFKRVISYGEKYNGNLGNYTFIPAIFYDQLIIDIEYNDPKIIEELNLVLNSRFKDDFKNWIEAELKKEEISKKRKLVLGLVLDKFFK